MEGLVSQMRTLYERALAVYRYSAAKKIWAAFVKMEAIMDMVRNNEAKPANIHNFIQAAGRIIEAAENIPEIPKSMLNRLKQAYSEIVKIVAGKNNKKGGM